VCRTAGPGTRAEDQLDQWPAERDVTNVDGGGDFGYVKVYVAEIVGVVEVEVAVKDGDDNLEEMLLAWQGGKKRRVKLALRTPRPSTQQRPILRFSGSCVLKTMGKGIAKSIRSEEIFQAVAKIMCL